MNFWRRFFKKSKEYFLEFTLVNTTWRVVTWNFDFDLSHGRQWSVETHGDRTMLIRWTLEKYPLVEFIRNKKLIQKEKLKDDSSSLKDLMNIALHSTIQHSLELNKSFMLIPVSGATSLDIQNEARALQWIQATFGTLLRSLDGFQTNKDLILTGAFFSGKVPQTQENVLRVIAFNLDIFYYFRPDHTLHIVIFDDKNYGHGTTKNPSFQQIIKVTKPQFYDEIIKLIIKLAKVGEIV
jgi:hypothetical protein